MATLEDVRRIALSLPSTSERIEGHRGGASWRTGTGMFVWERPPGKTDLAQLEELGRSWPSGTVVGVRVDGPAAKEALLAAFPEVFFTIPHFDGYPAVLIRLDRIDLELLRETVIEAWLLRAPKRLGERWLAEHGPDGRESGTDDSDGGRIVPCYSAAQIRAAEAPLLAAGEPLMARAASALAGIVDELLGEDSRVLVIAGSGNNGGDALYAAAHLANHAHVEVLLVSERAHGAALEAALAAGATRISLADAASAEHDIVVDGILGIGASADPQLRGEARRAVETLLPRVREGLVAVVAADVPSGLHPDTGAADDAVLPASTTVTFGGVKQGLTEDRGPELAGRIVLVDIGLGEQLARFSPAGSATVSQVVDMMAPAAPSPPEA